MALLFQAIIKGFGWALGVELGRHVARRLRLGDSRQSKQDPEEDQEMADQAEHRDRSSATNDSDRSSYDSSSAGSVDSSS